MAHTKYLVGRFAPEVVLVHHYDNFWHPYTHPRYRDLNACQSAVKEEFPNAHIYFPRFLEDLDFEQSTSSARGMCNRR